MPRLPLSPLRPLRAPLAVLLAFIIGAAGILTSTPRIAEAAPPTAITYTGSAANTGLANTPTTWTVGFTSSATGALAAGGTITVQFHAAFTIPATLPVGLSPTFANCSATGTAVGSVITVTLANSGGVCALPISTPATMTLGNIVNPSAGLYIAGATANFRVQTSSDNTFANHATNITISATAVTGVTFTGTPLTPAATSNFTAAFTVSAGGSLAAGNTITTTFSPAFALPGAPTITLGGTFQNCSATAVGAANVATITLADSGGTCALPASSPASVVVQGVTNPGAGVYPAASFSVATSKDVTATSPAAAGTVTIAATTATAVTFVGTPQTPGSVASWTVGFTPTAVGALTTGNTITVTFDPAFTVPAGAVAVTLSAAFNSCTATGNGVGTVVTVTLAGVGCALNSLTPATVTLAGITNPAAGVYAAAGFGVSTTRDVGVGLPANVSIATTAVTAVTFAGTPQTPGTVAPWVVGFTPSATGALAAADTITIVFNPSFTVPAGPTAVTLSAAFSGCTGSFTGAGTTATVTLAGGGCTLNGSTAATITIPGLTNPAVVGTYAAVGFSVRTSKDGTNVAPAAAVTIATTTVTAVTFAGTPQTPGTTASWVVGFTPSATGGLTNGNTIAIVFDAAFTVPAGPTAVTLSAAFSGCTGSFTGSGTTATVTLAGGGCTLNGLTAATITIPGLTNPAIVGTYAAAGFSVRTTRDGTNAVPAAAVTIATTAVTGVTFVGSPQTPGTTAAWTVGFTPTITGGLVAGNTITVTFDPAFVIPATPTITLGVAILACSATGATVGTTVTITLANSGGTCDVSNLTPATLTIAGITNPTAGVYPAAGFGVRTTRDGTTVLPANVTIATTAVTAVTFVGTPQTPGATAAWTVGFTPTATGSLTAGHTITVTFDPAFVIPGAPTITLGAAILACSATGATVGSTVTITLANSGGTCDVSSLTPVTLSIAGITNPTAGVYPAAGFGLRTTRDGTTVQPANVTIATTSVTAVTFVGTPQTPGATAAWTVGFTPTATGGLTTGNTITIVFNASFAVPAGPTAVTLSAAFSSCTGSATGAGTTLTVTLAGGGCTLNGSTAATITIPGITNPAVIGTYPAAGFTVRTTRDATNVVAGAAVTIATTSVTAVTFVGTPQTPGAAAAWTVGFTPTATGGLTTGNTITVVFDASFTVPAGPTAVTLSAAFSSCTGSATGAGTTLTVTLAGVGCTLNGSTAATVTIPGLTNPAVIGTYAAAGFTVRTTRDATNVVSGATVVIATTAVTAVTFAGTPQTPGSTAVWTVGFTPTAAGNLVAGNTVTVIFDPAFTIPGVPAITLPTGFASCTATGATAANVVTVTLAGGGCTLNGLTPATLTIAGITNPVAAVYAAAGFGLRTSANATTVAPAANVTIAAPAATAVTGVSFAGAPTAPNAVAAWTVGFTTSTSGQLAVGSTITVTFNGSFSIVANPVIALSPAFSGCTATATQALAVVTITLAGAPCSLAASTPATVTISSVTNPTAGSYPAAGFRVQTSADVTQVSPAGAGAVVVIAAASVSGVTLTAAPTSAASASVWSAGFTTSASGALAAADTISITFHPSFVLAGVPTISLGAAFTGCSATAASAASVITVTLANSGGACAVGASSPVSFTISGITNPSAGTYAAATFSIATSKDVTAVVAPAAVTITATPSSVTFVGATQTAGSVTTWTIGFRSSVAGALAAGDTITVTFNPAFVIPATPVTTVTTGFALCSATAAAAANVVTLTLANNGGVCAMPASTNALLTLAGLTNPLAGSYPAGGFTVATNRDNTAAAAASAVTITSGVGAVTFTAAPLTASSASTWTVGFTAGPSGALAAANTISLTFHPSFTVPATPTVTLGAGFSSCSATASGAGAVVTVTLASSGGVCALLANAAASLTVGGITNAATAATYPGSAFTVATSVESSASGAGTDVVITAAAGGGGGGGAPAPVVTGGGGGGGGGSAVPAPVGSPNAEPGLGPIGTSGATVATIAATSTSTVTVNTEEAHLTITAPAGVLPGGGQLFAGMVSDLSTVTRNATLPSTASLIAGFVVQATTRNGVPVTKDFGQLVELEITLQASSVPRTATNESLVLAYWEGTVWLEVPASVTVRLDGSAFIRATVDHFTLFGVIIRSVPLGSAPASAPGASTPPSTSAGVGAGTFASTPTFSATNQAISVFNGGSVDQLEAAARGAGASGVWAQDALGAFHLLIPGGPAFLRDAFAARFPRGFVGLTAMTLVRSGGTVSAPPAAPMTPTIATAPAAPSASGATTYVVASTDTLSEIGSRFDIPWLRIAEANGIAGPNYLVRPGQVLTIPVSGGAPSAAAPTPVAAVISIPTPVSISPASAPGTYVVSATDTLSDIAVRFGVPWQRIAAANGIAGPSYFVRSGQTLTIPSASGALSYVVTATDTLSSIGAQFNIDWLRLAEVNGIEGPRYFVRPGQTLTLPAS